jgi:lipopolysaccharide/colanic/teichoic acid biosynthesis glycosyltransferase
VPDLLQRALGAIGALVTLPIIICATILVRLETPGSLIYAADRMGRNTRPFSCYKIRTMRVPSSSGAGPAVTADEDRRITRIGRVLRRYRLDELPQLWNVAAGQMRLVGPRPEAPEFVDTTQALHRLVFSATPGITGLTQLAFVDESRLLRGQDPESTYRNDILPVKLRIDASYLDHRSARLDAWILARTVAAVLGRSTTIAEIERHVGQLGLEGIAR